LFGAHMPLSSILFIFFYLFLCSAPITGALNVRAASLRSAGTVFCLLFPPNARLSRVPQGFPLQPIVRERESAREGIIALGSAGRACTPIPCSGLLEVPDFLCGLQVAEPLTEFIARDGQQRQPLKPALEKLPKIVGRCQNET
jgi:hypothetical protein